MSHSVTMDLGNLFATPLNDQGSERAPPNINFCEIPSNILVPTMHTLCCISIVNGQCWVQFSQITPMKWIEFKWCLVGFPKPVPPLHCVHMFPICQDERCNHHDGCQLTFELSPPSPYMMQSQHTITKIQH